MSTAGHRFVGIAAHGDYDRHKPHPDPFLKAAERLGIAPQACLAVEDSHHGVRSASSAGMMTVMVPDLLPATDEICALCLHVMPDLHGIRDRRVSGLILDDDDAARRQDQRDLVAGRERPLDLGAGGEQRAGRGVDRIFHVRAEIARLRDRARQRTGRTRRRLDRDRFGPDRDGGLAVARVVSSISNAASPSGHAHAPGIEAAGRGRAPGLDSPMKRGEERRRRPLVEVARRALLLDAAGVHDDDAVGDRHRLLLVVRDVDHGEAEPLLQLADLLAHLAAQPGVEVAERLVEQQHRRLQHQGAGDGDALLLAARQLRRLALAVAVEADLGQALERLLLGLGLGDGPSAAGRRRRSPARSCAGRGRRTGTPC